jgi:hypothetical protein
MMQHQFNNPNGLRREMGLFSATTLVVDSMIDTGIFTPILFVIGNGWIITNTINSRPSSRC